VANPFESETEPYRVLVNDEGQHSLWPEFVDVPNGWRVVLSGKSRKDCIDYVDSHWTDMRPRSLVQSD
jgi:MbtH protein